MPLAPRVIRQDLHRRPQDNGAPKGAMSRIAVKEQRRLPDAISAESFAKLQVNPESRSSAKLVGLYKEMPAVGNQALDLSEHSQRELGFSGRKRNDNRFRIFTDQPEEESLQRGFHAVEFA